MKNVLNLLFLALMFFFFSCKKKDSEDAITPHTSACHVVEINKDIDTAVTWTNDNIYIINTSINIEATLTIEEGTIIKFKNGEGMRTGNACIHANGTVTNPIIFTAYTDDNYCGDSNGDGTASSPAKGFWGGILLASNVASTFEYCKILYAGATNANAAGTNNALWIKDYHVLTVIKHCTFAHTSGGLSNYEAAVYIDGKNQMTFTDNVIYDNGRAIYLDQAVTANYIDNSNTFANPTNASEKNVMQGIYIANDFDNTNDVNLLSNKIPYVIQYSGAGVRAGRVVNLSNDVIVKFVAGADISFHSNNNSGFIFNSTNLFTSIRDDTGGDSNGNGTATTPASGDWKGIYDIDNNYTYLTDANIVYDNQ